MTATKAMPPHRTEDLSGRAAELISSGTATSRPELSAELGVSAATASALVRRLIRDGVVEEDGRGTSSGGRRPVLLRPRARAGHVAVAELGARHGRVGLCDGAGTLICSTDVPLQIEEGAETVLATLTLAWERLAAEHDEAGTLVGAGIALPGPVDATSGDVVSPARMPGWNGAPVGRLATDALGVPTVIENDARAGGYGEWSVRPHKPDHFLYVKVGTGIGSAWISGGAIHRGADGLAGDVAHSRVDLSADAVTCSCGNRGCLETVASGAAVRRDLADAGGEPSLADILALATDSDPVVMTRLRSAGMLLGRALAPLVNFLNPDMIVLGGALSSVDALVAGVRGEIYDQCLPMCTAHLSIERAAAGADASLHGLGRLARERLAATTNA